MALRSTTQADREEDRARITWKPWKPVAMKKVERIDAAGEMERSVGVFVGLHRGEAQAQQHGDRQALDQPLLVAFEQRVMGPGHGRARTAAGSKC